MSQEETVPLTQNQLSRLKDAVAKPDGVGSVLYSAIRSIVGNFHGAIYPTQAIILRLITEIERRDGMIDQLMYGDAAHIVRLAKQEQTAAILTVLEECGEGHVSTYLEG